MTEKLNRAALCLYAIAGIQILSFIYVIYSSLQLFQYSSLVSISPVGIIAPALFWAACVIVAIYKTAPELRKQTPWAWAVSVGIFVLAIPSWTLPASVIGLISLLDVEVRTHFLEKLNIKI